MTCAVHDPPDLPEHFQVSPEGISICGFLTLEALPVQEARLCRGCAPNKYRPINRFLPGQMRCCYHVGRRVNLLSEDLAMGGWGLCTPSGSENTPDMLPPTTAAPCSQRPSEAYKAYKDAADMEAAIKAAISAHVQKLGPSCPATEQLEAVETKEKLFPAYRMSHLHPHCYLPVLPSMIKVKTKEQLQRPWISELCFPINMTEVGKHKLTDAALSIASARALLNISYIHPGVLQYVGDHLSSLADVQYVGDHMSSLADLQYVGDHMSSLADVQYVGDHMSSLADELLPIQHGSLADPPAAAPPAHCHSALPPV
eukprot:gene15428-21511_t